MAKRDGDPRRQNHQGSTSVVVPQLMFAGSTIYALSGEQQMDFPILGDATNDVVLCALCDKRIEEDQESTLYHVRHNDKAQLAHTKCTAANLARIVNAMGRFGGSRMGAALKLDR